ncbi:MAG: hypothetical protein J6Q68_03245, partial [Clostridia bacterium]|nr:hypothetical protein [Clostridia bacterium]
MIDFHSHILPRLDDGAKSTEESVALLDMLEKQGVNHVFATPHFLPEKEALHEFIRQRDEAYASLLDVYSGGVSISVGAEVAYFRGITRIAEIESLKLSGTELWLLEMPMMPWSSYMTKELIELAYSTKTVPVIAHIERCMAYQKPAVLWDMIESGVLMQANATFFADVKTKRKAIKLLKKGFI